MDLLKVLQLPKWSILNKYPAFYDIESLTTLDQTARLYGKMKEVIESYNEWVEEVNKLIVEYKEEEDRQDTCFEEKILKITNDFIASVEDKMAFQNAEFLEIRGLIDDLNGNIKVEVESATRSIIETMKESGEFNDLILSTLDEVNERLAQYENEITQKFNDLQATVQGQLDSLANVSGDLADLKARAETLEGDNEKNKEGILTNQTNYYNLKSVQDSLVTDNQTNKNNIETLQTDTLNLENNKQNKLTANASSGITLEGNNIGLNKDIGLASRGYVDTYTDYNNIKSNGIYRLNKITKNAPSVLSDWGTILIVFRPMAENDSVVVQLCVQGDGTGVDIRTCWYGTWIDWRKLF